MEKKSPRWRSAVVAGCVFGASEGLAQEVLHCADTEVVGFKWDGNGQASTEHFNPERYTVEIGPATDLLENERVITQTTGTELKNKPIFYQCNKSIEQTVCNNERDGTMPWLFVSNGHYVRGYLGGGPPSAGSQLDPNVGVAYGTCTKF